MSEQLTRGKVMVEWEELGEGESGEYDETDPNDTEYLRFYVRVEKDLGFGHYEWEDVEDASYCTRVPVSTGVVERARLLGVILEATWRRVEAGLSIKKDCEVLSWIAPGAWLTAAEAPSVHGRNLGEIDPREV